MKRGGSHINTEGIQNEQKTQWFDIIHLRTWERGIFWDLKSFMEY